MRLECSVFVGFRRLHNNDCKLGRPSRCFLGLGKSRSLKHGDVLQFHVIIQYQSRKTEKFQIGKEFVQSVMKSQQRFGKMTILLNTPPANIYISEADPSKLSMFARLFEQIINDNKLEERHFLQDWEKNCSKSEIAAGNTRRLHISHRKDYPKSAGFPSALRELCIAGVGLKSIDIRWFGLTQLTVLNLSSNKLGGITDLIEWRKFASISRLKQLKELYLRENNFHRLPIELINALPTSLMALFLDENFIGKLPNEICRLHNLQILSLNFNKLTELPEDLCLLNDLRSLTVSDNDLRQLPAVLFTRRQYGHFLRLDFSNNRALSGIVQKRRLLFCNEVPSLKSITAAALLNSSYFNRVVELDVLPRDISIYMRNWLQRCCSCYRLYPCCNSDISRLVNVEMIKFSADMYSGPANMMLEQFFCLKCTSAQQMSNLPTKLANSFDCRQGTVRSVRFNVDGNYCITAGSDKTIKLWNPHRQIHLKSYTGLGSEALDACGACDNATILAGGRDCQPTIFDVETGKMLKRWRDHGGPVNAVIFNEDSSLAISGSQDGTIQLHDVRSRGPPVQTLDEATDAVLCVDVSGYEIASGSADSYARLYDIREGRMFMDFMGDAITDVHLTSDSQCVLLATMHSPVRLVEKCNGQLLTDYTGHRNETYRLQCGVLASNNEVISGSEDGHVYIWDMVDNKKILSRLSHSGMKFISSLAPHPTQQILLSTSAQHCFYWIPESTKDDD